ncbi:MAG: Asp-tRNA(Asn)/Glu-tRNA(Gln) amidotransferase subunit GatA [Candidatus Moraniibacteriota bacterium]|nr:MAG: Asp-tRNA(Asn)/Glu-tRNA(Gln) amidotransferase subunit GatA [Candidatus Moranbacteria bacterium]
MIRQLQEKLRKREITSRSIVESYFEVIEKKEKDLDAFVTLRKEKALQEADTMDIQFDLGREMGMLSGIPYAAKDNMCVEGESITAGSRMLSGFRAPYNATVIQRLAEEGAILVGITNMDEFAMGSSTETSAYKKTKNPHDISRVPGGSSGGSAVAVASGMVPWALGSDTGGSIRQPASFCGTVGLKPTYGRVSRYGLLAMASSLDQIGPFAMSVEDTAIILSSLSGEDIHDATTAQSFGKRYEDFLTGDITGKKIGVIKEWIEHKGLDPEIRQKIEESLTLFKEKGAIVEYVSLPTIEYAIPVYYILVSSEVSSNMARYDSIRFGSGSPEAKTIFEVYSKSRSQFLGSEVKRRIMLGTYALSSGYYDAYYKKAQKVRSLIRKDFERVFEEVDLLFGPTSPEVAFEFGAKIEDPLSMYLSDIYTVTANIAGVPAISFPIGSLEKNGKSLPIGGQLMAKWFDEEGLLAAADVFEKALMSK